MNKFNVIHGDATVKPAPIRVLQIQDLISFSAGMSRDTKIKIDGDKCFVYEIPDVLGAKDHWVEIAINDFIREDLELCPLIENLIEDNHLIALKRRTGLDNFWEYPYDKFPIIRIEKHDNYIDLRTI